jgi:hypothetical protein
MPPVVTVLPPVAVGALPPVPVAVVSGVPVLVAAEELPLPGLVEQAIAAMAIARPRNSLIFVSFAPSRGTPNYLFMLPQSR